MNPPIKSPYALRFDMRFRNTVEKVRWDKYRKNRGWTRSELVRNAVENFINPLEGASSTRELREQVEKQEVRIRELEGEIEIRNSAIETYRRRMKTMEEAQFIRKGGGTAHMSKKLVGTLRQDARQWSEQELFMEMGIEQGDMERMKAMSKQLQLLEEFGLLENRRGRWTWITNGRTRTKSC